MGNTYYSAELSLAQGQLKELLDYVQLYQALGGGWQQYAPSERAFIFPTHDFLDDHHHH